MKKNQSSTDDSFLKHNAIFFSGGVLVAGLNYLFYPILSRQLSVADFGEMQIIISFTTQFGVLLSAIGLVVMNIVASQSKEQRNTVVAAFEQITALFVVILGIALLLSLSHVRDFLQFESSLPFIIALFVLFLAVPATLRRAYVQGQKQFTESVISNSVGAISRIIFAVAFVAIGWRTAGAVAGVALSQVIAFLYLLPHLRKAGYKTMFSLNIRSSLASIRSDFGYVAIVIVSSLFVFSLYNVDLLLVKHLFSPEEAGRYAGIAIVARGIVFMAAALNNVLFVSVKRGQSHARNLAFLKRSMLLLSAFGVSVVLTFWIAPTQITRIMLGADFTDSADLLPKLGLWLLVVAFVNMLFYYFLALRHKATVLIALAGGAVSALLLTGNHDTTSEIISSLQYGSMFTLVLLIGWGVISHRKGTRKSI